MRIAQVSPLIESVPPRLYGGTERVVSYLTEELVAQGHDVTLFASGDSITSATLVPCSATALRLGARTAETLPYHAVMIDKVLSAADEFDVLHFHIDYLHFPLVRHVGTPSVTTLHGRQDLAEAAPFFAYFRDEPLVSISDAQRRPIAGANFVSTILHGLPLDLHHASEKAEGGYLAFLGRVSPEKGPVEAIRIAVANGVPLKIAAKVDTADREYFEQVVKPLLDLPGIEYVGELSEQKKGAFLRGAAALLFPICWPEPFGLVMIEAMACGTPTLAFDRGSVREVIEDGITGHIVDDLDQAIAALPKVISLDRLKVRRRFEKRFSAERMTNDYVRLYQALTQKRGNVLLKPGSDDTILLNGDDLLSDSGLHAE